MSSINPTVHRLLVDASAEFPYLPGPTHQKPTNERQTTAVWSTSQPVSSALLFLNEAERTKVLKYYHPRDAALSLSSVLLKRFAIARYLFLSWYQSPITQERHLHNGRPFFDPSKLEEAARLSHGPDKSYQIDFNVSHHGSLAVLVCTTAQDLQVGIDVVEVNVEKDARSIQGSGGWRKWVQIFSDAFTPAEVQHIQSTVPASTDLSIAQERSNLRDALATFYAHWALKEAYIKMTSEAFMATWLRDLEFRKVRTPERGNSNTTGQWTLGETVVGIEVWLHGKRVPDVQVELQAVGDSYMVATATNRGARIDEMEHVTVEKDIKPLASSDRP